MSVKSMVIRGEEEMTRYEALQSLSNHFNLWHTANKDAHVSQICKPVIERHIKRQSWLIASMMFFYTPANAVKID